MLIPIILFAVGALFGLHIVTHIFKTKPTPKVSVLFHGLFVVTALILVISAVAEGASGLIVTSLVFFIIAALGGLTMFYIDIIKKQTPPKLFAVLHPMAAATGLILLIIYHFNQ